MTREDVVNLKMEYRDGSLYWKSHKGMTAPWAGRFLGKKVDGYVRDHGYSVITQNNKGKQFAIGYHRAVYQLVWGPIPKGYEIDHIDRNKLNNHPLNLRVVTRSQNNQNRKVPNRSTGIQYIRHCKKRSVYIVRFRIGDRYEKTFPTLEDAMKARNEQLALRGLSFQLLT